MALSTWGISRPRRLSVSATESAAASRYGGDVSTDDAGRTGRAGWTCVMNARRTLSSLRSAGSDAISDRKRKRSAAAGSGALLRPCDLGEKTT